MVQFIIFWTPSARLEASVGTLNPFSQSGTIKIGALKYKDLISSNDAWDFTVDRNSLDLFHQLGYWCHDECKVFDEALAELGNTIENSNVMRIFGQWH